jgi:hypothetical protein
MYRVLGKPESALEMSARIGNVIYWFGCVITGLTAMMGIYVYVMDGHSRSDGVVVTAGFFAAALVFWLIGRAVLYVLSAK